MLVPPTGRVAAEGIRDAGTLILGAPGCVSPRSLRASWQAWQLVAADHTATSGKGRQFHSRHLQRPVEHATISRNGISS